MSWSPSSPSRSARRGPATSKDSSSPPLCHRRQHLRCRPVRADGSATTARPAPSTGRTPRGRRAPARDCAQTVGRSAGFLLETPHHDRVEFRWYFAVDAGTRLWLCLDVPGQHLDEIPCEHVPAREHAPRDTPECVDVGLRADRVADDHFGRDEGRRPPSRVLTVSGHGGRTILKPFSRCRSRAP